MNTYTEMSVGSNIRSLRKRRGWTLLDLSTRADMDSGYLSRLERDLTGFSTDSLSRIAQALNVPRGELFTDEPNVLKVEFTGRPIPVLDYIQAGKWKAVTDSRSESDIFELLLTSIDVSPDAFSMKIRGDSMMPDFKEGDYIIVDPDVAPNPGDFVVAKADDKDEATFKQYRERGVNDLGHHVFELVPLNSFYSPVRSDFTPIKIIGTVVGHQRKLRR